MKCPYCNKEMQELITETPELTHYGKAECSECRRWLRWVKSPDKENKRTRTSKIQLDAVFRAHKFNTTEPFCFFCLRSQKQLPSKHTLTLDHIEELNTKGNDDINNLQILCTACHKLKNWMRLYNNWHIHGKK